MTMAFEFDYAKPVNLAEAFRLLARRVPGGAVPLAGGTDLVAWLRDGTVQPGLLVDLKGLAELQGIRFQNGVLWIGAAATFSELIDSPMVRRHVPILTEAAGMVASAGVRNRATLGGNLCSAVPCCDSGPALLVYGAVMHVATRRGNRDIPAAQWFKGPRQTALTRGAILSGISIPVSRHAGAYAKLKRYRGEDLAQASVAVHVKAKGVWAVAYGSVAPTPIRGSAAERVLKGSVAPKVAILAQAAALAESEVAPITDIRGSQIYRRLMVGVMLKRAVHLASLRFAGNGPDYGLNILEEDVP